MTEREAVASGDRAVEAPATAAGRSPAGVAPTQVELAVLRGLVEGAAVPACTVDRKYRCTSFNRACGELVAALYGGDVALGASLLDGIPARPRAAARERLERALAGESFVDDAVEGSDGETRRHFRVAYGPIRGEGGGVVGAALFATEVTEQRRAEEALRGSDARYRALFEAAPAMIHSIDRDGRIVAVSDGWLATMGYTRGEVVGRRSTEFLTEASRRYATEEVIPEFMRTGECRGIGYQFVRKDGRVLDVLLSAVSEQDGAGRVVRSLAVITDITEHKRAEDALRRLNRQLRAIGECSQALMKATDEQTILDEVCRIVCELGGHRMTWVGYVEHDEARSIRPVAVAGADDGYVASSRLSWAEDSERGRGPAGTSVRTGATFAYQDLAAEPAFGPWRDAALARGYRSGVCLPLKDEVGAVFGLLLIYAAEPDAFEPEEITLLEGLAADLAFGIMVLRARARRDEAERSVAHLSFALDNVREAAFLVDESARLEYVNDAACRALGYERGELLGRTVADIDPDFPLARWPAHWTELKTNRALRFETRHRAKDGHTFPVELSTNYFEYAGQGYNLALAHDVTERRRLEEQLRQVQKMEAIGTLAGGVAHDFNNVLTGIVGYGHVLEEELPPDSPLREPVEQILEAAARATQLTRGLLAFSRRQVIHSKPIDLNEVVRSVEKLLRRVIGEDVEVSTALAEHPVVVMGDAGQLEQVLMNLATNARDAMPEGGVLSIATEIVEVDEGYVEAHGGGRAGRHARLSVSDDGVGMDEATRRKAFEPFFTSKAPGKGTGLGLAIVYGIVKQHGGSVDLYSEPGQGTTVKILLPVVDRPVEPARPEVVERPAGGTETILLAEDDPIVRKMLCGVLRGQGYRIIEAFDGQDALERFAAHRGELAMLILDVVMPRKSGREVYDAVKAQRPDVRVLFLSGYTADIIHKKGIFDEGLQFVSKPVSPLALLRRVRGILDGP
jgi:PAS domain S-box-containing protein